jgi:glycosyltransferase involved in cell wall biosynthesis
MNKYADLPMGNNPAMPIFYKCRKPFALVSKGLVKESEIQLKERKSLDEKLIKLVFFSRLDPEKNLELILDAMALIKSTGRNIELKVFGGTPMVQYLDFLRKKITELDSEVKLKFISKQKDNFEDFRLKVLNKLNVI